MTRQEFDAKIAELSDDMSTVTNAVGLKCVNEEKAIVLRELVAVMLEYIQKPKDPS